MSTSSIASLLLALACSLAALPPAQAQAGAAAEGRLSPQDLLALIEAGELDRAERILRRNLPRASERPAIDYLLGVLLVRRFALDEAQQHLLRAVQRRPAQVNWLHALATAYAMAGQCRAAIAWLDRAIALQPQTPALRYDRARCRLEGGDLAGAVDELRAVLAIAPDFAGANGLLGRSLVQLGQDEPARPILQAAVVADPEDLESRLLLARLQEAAGDAEAAERSYRAILQRAPTHPAASYALGGLLRRSGRLQEAQAQLQVFAAGVARRERIENRRQYLVVNPADAAVRRELATLLLEDGDHAGVLLEARQSLALDPTSTAGLRLMAEAHARRGEAREAQRLRAEADRLEAAAGAR